MSVSCSTGMSLLTEPRSDHLRSTLMQLSTTLEMCDQNTCYSPSFSCTPPSHRSAGLYGSSSCRVDFHQLFLCSSSCVKVLRVLWVRPVGLNIWAQASICLTPCSLFLHHSHLQSPPLCTMVRALHPRLSHQPDPAALVSVNGQKSTFN